MTIKIKVSEVREPVIITEDEHAAMTLLGEDFTKLLEKSDHPDMIAFGKSAGINILTLHKIKKGVLTGDTVALATIYMMADKLDAEVVLKTPRDEWNHKTSLRELWKMGATIRLIPRHA